MARPRRLEESAYVGVRQYSLTFCTYQRRREFVDGDTVALVLDHFLQQAVADQVELLAYCFMPDHVHLVATATAPERDFRPFIKLAKQKSGFAFSQVTGRRLWQDSYYDRAVRDDQSPAAIVRYVIENPIRAGLVAVVEEYPFWGSQLYSRAELLEYIATECRV